jgi:hypothetical protein
MSDSTPSQHSRSAFTAPVLVVFGLAIAIAAWLLPVNLKSVSPALLEAAGHGTPSLGAYGRDLVDVEKIGPAALVLDAARATDDPRAPALASAIEQFASRQPGLMAWGGWDPFLDPLFNLRANTGRGGSTPVLTFFIPERARETLRGYLSKSGSEAVLSLLKLRELTATGHFVPAMRPGGQPLDALVLLTGLLYQGGHLSSSLQRELRSMTATALQKKELGEFENYFINLLSLGKRLDWTQLAELMRRTDSLKTFSQYAQLSREAPNQLPLIYAAALFSDSADRVAAYVIQFGTTGLDDLKLALGYGQGAVRQLLLRQVPVNRTASPALTSAAELALTHPQLMLAMKYLGVLIGVWLMLRGLDQWLVGPGSLAGLPMRFGHMRAGVVSFVLAVLLLVVTEPFLLQAAPVSEFQIRRPVLVVSSVIASADTQPINNMEATNLISIAVFAVLQIMVYLVCLRKIREISQRNVPALVKLRLMENEENLFDLGLYVGIGGTAAAMVLITLGIAKANLIAAFSSNLFGITCVALVKILHVRPFKRQLILEGQIAASPVREPNEPSVASARGSAAL